MWYSMASYSTTSIKGDKWWEVERHKLQNFAEESYIHTREI